MDIKQAVQAAAIAVAVSALFQFAEYMSVTRYIAKDIGVLDARDRHVFARLAEIDPPKEEE